jgi:hypothetical protein
MDEDAYAMLCERIRKISDFDSNFFCMFVIFEIMISREMIIYSI